MTVWQIRPSSLGICHSMSEFNVLFKPPPGVTHCRTNMVTPDLLNYKNYKRVPLFVASRPCFLFVPDRPFMIHHAVHRDQFLCPRGKTETIINMYSTFHTHLNDSRAACIFVYLFCSVFIFTCKKKKKKSNQGHSTP